MLGSFRVGLVKDRREIKAADRGDLSQKKANTPRNRVCHLIRVRHPTQHRGKNVSTWDEFLSTALDDLLTFLGNKFSTNRQSNSNNTLYER